MSGVANWLPALPTHWEMGQLRWLASIYSGGTPSRENMDYWTDGDIPWLASGVVNQWVVTEPTEYITEAGLRESAARWVPENAVLMGLAGQGRTKGLVARTSIRATCNQSLCAIVPRKSLEERYLHYWLSINHENLRNLAGGDKRDGLNHQLVGSVMIPLPPLAEQLRIADFLDRETAKIDTLIKKQNALIERLRERRLHMVAHAVTPAEMDRDDFIALKRALQRVEQGISPDTSTGNDSAEVWVLKAGASNRGHFDESESKPVPSHITVPAGIEIQQGDLVASRASGSVDLVASVAMVPELSRRLILSDKNFRLVPIPSVDTRYMYWSLNSPSYRSQVRLAISGADGLANNIPLNALRRIRVWMPPLHVQRAIANHLDRETAKIDSLISKAERFVELARERRAALITAGVTGQLDVEGAA